MYSHHNIFIYNLYTLSIFFYLLGSKDGQTKMVRDGELVSVHSWSMGDQGSHHYNNK